MSMIWKLAMLLICHGDYISRDRFVVMDNDEDIICSNTTTLASFDSKVKLFFVMIVFDTFDELMVHHDVCSLSFSEIHTWIKKY
jgi:hypothetical protein